MGITRAIQFSRCAGSVGGSDQRALCPSSSARCQCAFGSDTASVSLARDEASGTIELRLRPRRRNCRYLPQKQRGEHESLAQIRELQARSLARVMEATLEFKRINGSKFRPKQRATKRNHTAAVYHPQPLAAAGQHIDTERLPDSMVTKLPEPSRSVGHADSGSFRFPPHAAVGWSDRA